MEFIRNKRAWLWISLLCAACLLCSNAHAQIVSARSPIGIVRAGVRSAALLPTSWMPHFDRDSALLEMELRDQRLRTYDFAHKLYTDVDVIAAGDRVEHEGHTAWLYRVRSTGAVSLNFYFSDFHLPAGGALYIYTPDMKKMLGGFGPENNSPSHTLPTGLIAADEVIIECQVPTGGELPRLRLGEVNHGVRGGHLPGEPRFGESHRMQVACAPELVCMPEFKELGRSVVLLALNGITLGTGMLINNTRNDGTPYIITAAHVYTGNCRWSEHEELAKTVVAFFNYESPSCSGEIRPNEEQALAGASLVSIDTWSDVCLIKLNQRPPREYRPYYAGWNAQDKPKPPYVNIHHPQVLPKRVSISRTQVVPSSFSDDKCMIAPNRHWKVSGWSIGTTAPGSSGSPLFDANQLYVGGLTGGESYCATPDKPDSFFSLHVISRLTSTTTVVLMEALRPGNPTADTCPAYDPYYALTPLRRLSHVQGVESKESLSTLLAPLTRDEILNTAGGSDAIVEAYDLKGGGELLGFYTLLSASAQSGTPTPIPYKIFDLKSKSVLASGMVSLDRLLTYDKSSGTYPTVQRTIDSYMEVYTPLPQPLYLPQEGRYGVALYTKELSHELTPMLQTKTLDHNTIYRIYGDKWVESPSDAYVPFAGSMWVDLLTSATDASESDQPGEQEPFTLSKHGANNLILWINNYAAEASPGTLHIHDLKGRQLLQSSLDAPFVVIPRTGLEGIGVIILSVRYQGKQKHYKLILPTE